MKPPSRRAPERAHIILDNGEAQYRRAGSDGGGEGRVVRQPKVVAKPDEDR